MSLSIEHSSSHCTVEEEIEVELYSFTICETKPSGACTALCRCQPCADGIEAQRISLSVKAKEAEVLCQMKGSPPPLLLSSRHICSIYICGSAKFSKNGSYLDLCK